MLASVKHFNEAKRETSLFISVIYLPCPVCTITCPIFVPLFCFLHHKQFLDVTSTWPPKIGRVDRVIMWFNAVFFRRIQHLNGISKNKVFWIKNQWGK